MQRMLKQKWMCEGKFHDDPDGKKFTIRFPNNFKLPVRIESDKSTKVPWCDMCIFYPSLTDFGLSINNAQCPCDPL